MRMNLVQKKTVIYISMSQVVGKKMTNQPLEFGTEKTEGKLIVKNHDTISKAKFQVRYVIIYLDQATASISA